MGESQQQATKPELYERLIDRLGLALEVARTSVRLRDEVPAELELRGLSRAEFEVIKAYLESLPEGGHGRVGALPQPETPPSARIVWLKDKRSATTAKSRTLQFK
ncbi:MULTISPECIES: hypothetical protein [Pseudomonas]|uniref:hypothetical protein n=1 Tax=Pseudomonas TaxID=286 RepID=UPI0020B76C05|nr:MULTISPECIES: hypothetical protein [Pseudomonas]MBF4208680.1 hypothetical protein [Pseudomonas donghuensis]MCP3751761.1 hypothetical protein [Pseudomonas sp. SBB6]MCP6698793.1 hypothetical protein [Pseudomonas donghuensis]WSE82808.1 hypothetical protein VP780_23565 [Pseudomonas donghuensis]